MRKLSIVVTSRNDDRDKTLIVRMQFFVNSLFYQLQSVNLPVELIIVEWNPPAKKKLLKEVLDFTIKPNRCSVKIITVPSATHQKFKNSQKLGLFQFIAKNVGIRRAEGTFVLATNIDIIFSLKSLKFLASKEVKENVLLRAVRFDVPSNLVSYSSIKNLNNHCKNKIFRAFWPWGTEEIDLKTSNKALIFINKLRLAFFNNVFTNASGDFTLLSKKSWEALKGYPEFPLHGFKIDSLLCHNAVASGIKQRILDQSCAIFHIDHALSWNSKDSPDIIESLQKKGIPIMDRAIYNSLIKKILTTKKPIIFNDSQWGLKDAVLKEHIL